MKKQGKMVQSKEQNKCPETNPPQKNPEVYELPDKEFKRAIKNVLNELWKMMHVQNENFNKEIENIKNKQIAKKK